MARFFDFSRRIASLESLEATNTKMPYIYSPPSRDGTENGVNSLKQSRMLRLMEQNAQRQASVSFPVYNQVHQPLPAVMPTFQPFKPSPPKYAFEQAGFAPVLPSRVVQLPAKPRSEAFHQTTGAEQAYFEGPVPNASPAAITEAFATWYTDQVIDLLVVPGSFRRAVGGSSDDVWGRNGRERQERERMVQQSPDFPQPWGRMGMPPASEQPRVRRPSTERQDPWCVYRSHGQSRSRTLVNFIQDVITRMSITPVAVVSAVWYLHGLGLHEGDGKGAELRALLRHAAMFESEGVEKRVAVIGLLLAGKWLDDNSFLTKSWTEVTQIPIKEIDRLERLCLRDYNHSLFIPVPSWVDHVNKLYGALIATDALDNHSAIVVAKLDEMAAEARASELGDPRAPEHQVARRMSLEELPAAGEQAISRDWDNYALSYAIDSLDAEAERNVSLLVDDDDYDGKEAFFVDESMDNQLLLEEDEEEYVEYDGARPFIRRSLPLERTSSHSSARSIESHLSQMRYDPMAVEPPRYSLHHKAQFSSPIEDMLEPGYYVEPGVQIVAPPPKQGGAICGWNRPVAIW